MIGNFSAVVNIRTLKNLSFFSKLNVRTVKKNNYFNQSEYLG